MDENIGRSKIVPFKLGEDSKDRHSRRLFTNLEHQKRIRKWAENYNIILKITNQGHHWRFIHGTYFAEWWPSSAKLVFNGYYTHGFHAHDYVQVKEQLIKKWGLE